MAVEAVLDGGDETQGQPLCGSSPEEGDVVEGQMYFLARDERYEQEKPYTLRYAPAAETGVAQTNIERVAHPVRFRDLRHRLETDERLRYDKCGFAVVQLPETPLDKRADTAEERQSRNAGHDGHDGHNHNLPLPFPYEDYSRAERIEGVHAPQVLEAVRQALGAASAELIDYVVRRRHAAWPVSTGEPYAFQQPASRAHIDHTFEGGVAVIREAHGADADAVLSRRWQLVNAWHPLQGPLVDWPLAVCDAQTVDFARDTMAGDVVDRHQVFENTQVHYNAAQTWYYLRHQMPNELIIFKNADGQEPAGAVPGVPHGSFDNPAKTAADLLRESIEMRILVVW